MSVKSGIYEQLINALLQQQLEEVDPHVFIEKEQADQAELANILARYLFKILYKGLECLKGTNKENKQIQLCNDIIQLVADEIAIDDFKRFTIPQIPEVLLSVINKIEIPSFEPPKLIRPVTSLSESSLFTGSPLEPTLASEIRKEILSSDEVLLLVSFLKWSGIRILAEELEEFTKNKKGRLKIKVPVNEISVFIIFIIRSQFSIQKHCPCRNVICKRITQPCAKCKLGPL